MLKNPIIPGFAPDPSITYWDGYYYIVTSTFEYFPGVTLWRSANLVSWENIGAVLTRGSQLNLDKALPSSGLYAATIRVNNSGRFYVVTTNKYTHENFICHTDDILGEWSEISFITSDGIDPSLLFLPDGRCFYTSNGSVDGKRCIKGAFINPDNGQLLEDFHLLSTGCGGSSPEGPHVYYINNWYYLMLAEGGTGYGHHEVILRSQSIYGPYEKNPNNPILSHVSRKGHVIQATGHADLIETPQGEWYAVFLAIRVKPRPLLHHLGRETFLAKVEWKDNWPMIGDEGKVELSYATGPDCIDNDDYSVQFSKPIASWHSLKVRKPKDNCYIINTKEKKLILVGEENINTPLAHPTLLAFRQRGFHEKMEAILSISNLEGRAGIASWLSSDYHYRLEIKKTKKHVVASLVRHIHDFEATTKKMLLPILNDVKLTITSDENYYYFFVNGIFLDKASVYGLSQEGTMYNSFTGALFAVYAEEGKATFLEGITMKSISEENK